MLVHHVERLASHRSHVLLATCQVKLQAKDGTFVPVRVLIDPGSELSFMTENLVHRLRLNRQAASIPLLGIGGTRSGQTKGMVSARLYSMHNLTASCQLQAYILTQLAPRLPPFTAATASWAHLHSLPLADPEYWRPGPIDIIIGSDSYGKILKPDIIPGNPPAPLAQLTIFGWILSGPVEATNESSLKISYHCSVDHDLDELMTRFWHQEELSSTKTSPLSPDEIECESFFQATVTRNEEGRYIVRLPLKSSASTLGDSTVSALRCLERLRQRLATDHVYRDRYSDFIQEYEFLGHMSQISTSIVDVSPMYYLPHHGVLREQNRTTKLRVVFNGSSRTSTGISLNDILHSGAKLQSDISDVLLWVRRHRYVFSTDIVKMYRQIKVHSDDWNLQRIFWYGLDQQILSYHLTTVTYGLSCAPFLALRTLQQLVQDEGHKYPLAVPSLTKGRYVDDIFGGADSVSEINNIVDELKKLCTAGGFPLQKWSSNCSEVLIHLNEIPVNKTPTVEIESSKIKILGVCWKPSSDTFQITIQPSTHNNVTKRIVLSEIAQLFDPLGLISPVIIRAKIFIQELWLLKISWDDPLPLDLKIRWENFRQQLQTLNTLEIPRWMHLSTTVTSVELHGFSDASQLAMAAVIYLRVIDKSGQIFVCLVCSKTRVAPLKRLTIPRLELTAALLLARLTNHVQRTLDLTKTPTFLWSDSSVALTWISAHPSRWKDYVRNRVAAIQEVTPSANWRFISGSQNPADCASRGIKADQLEHHALWWTGPSWLIQPSSTWPNSRSNHSPEANLEERPGIILTTSSRDFKPKYWTLLERYSTLTRLLRITATCNRVIARFRHTHDISNESSITPTELQRSSFFWVKEVQRAYFSQETIQMILQGSSLPKTNPLNRLTPFIDTFGMLRVGGRLQNSRLDSEAKHPLILPRNSPLTSLIIADAHQRTFHGGTQVTLNFIRQNYWILGGRAPVRSFILRCIRCARYRGVRAQQLMGQLPSPRVTPSRPFLHSGIDYAGPILLKTWRGRTNRHYKGYLSIFVCLSTSAIHIELVTDYTTEAFIAAYKRFTGRRGICASLYSDCGTNLVGADAALRKRFDLASEEFKETASLLANDGTLWHFNPPSAPHFGGKWEAAVKSTKFHLLRTIGESILTYEELNTLLIQIEATLNSRPLSALSDDSEDISALTPGHFLIGEPLTTLPEPTYTDLPENRLTRWQLLRQKLDYFWKRWQAECLQRHQSISKWHHPSHKIKEGSLVLMTDERYPPAKWPLARVTQLHPGKDGLTRVVTLKTSTSTFKRPIAKLSILPVNDSENCSTTTFPKAGGMLEEDKAEAKNS